MFKKTMLLGSILLVSACSSKTVSTDYVKDVVVQKNKQDGYIETVGKDIVPVDLLELNLGLKMSVLSVTSKVQTTAEQATQKVEPATTEVPTTQSQTESSEAPETATVDGTNTTVQESTTNDDVIKSDVFFEIQYSQEKNESDKDTFNQYNVALVDGVNVALVSNKASQKCDDKTCLVSQSFSFPVNTALLENSTVDGLKFSLLETTNNEKLVLETMIPGRYLNALFAKETSK